MWLLLGIACKWLLDLKNPLMEIINTLTPNFWRKNAKCYEMTIIMQQIIK